MHLLNSMAAESSLSPPALEGRRCDVADALQRGAWWRSAVESVQLVVTNGSQTGT